MGRNFITPRTDTLYRDSVESLVDALSKKFKFFVVTETLIQPCGNCIWDQVHECSTGVYNSRGPRPFNGIVCPVCQGAGKVSVPKKLRVPASVQWGRPGPNTANTPTPGGILPEGYARVKVKMRYRPTIEKAEFFLINNVRCSMVGEPINRGLQTQVITELVVKRDD